MAAADGLAQRIKAAKPANDEGQYRELNGRLCRVHNKTTQPLCNFSARLVEQVIHDNGDDALKTFALEGRLDDGTPLPRIEVAASAFSGMGWVAGQWGCQPNIYVGLATKDHVRSAIQELSGQVPTRTVYSHTGWRHLDGAWHYLHGGGALSAAGHRGDIEVCPGSGPMQHYRLPEPPEGAALVEAVRASLDLMTLTPNKPAIGALLLACIYRAPVAALLPVDHAVFLVGLTGARKSEAAALVLAHYGQGFTSRTFPAGWSDTTSALELKAYAAKDAVIVVDDFKPTGGKKDVDELHRKAESLFRGAGNQSGRGRLSAGLKQRAAYHPRGMVLATGEDIPKGQSLRARLTIGELSRDALDPRQGDIDLTALTALQDHARQGRLVAALAGFVRWLAPQMDALKAQLPDAVRARRDQAIQTGLRGHSRAPSDFASLCMGLELLARFAEACGALSGPQARDFLRHVVEHLRILIEAQGEHQDSQDDVTRFVSLLTSALASGRCHMADLQGSDKGCPTDHAPYAANLLGWRKHSHGSEPQGACIGWIDEGVAYLDGEATYAVVSRYANEQGGLVELTQRTLFQRIHERGLLARVEEEGGKVRLQVRKRIYGPVKRLYAVNLSVLLGEPP